MLLISLCKFWINVKIENRSLHLEEISAGEDDVTMFHKRGRSTIFTHAFVVDGETFYLHCAKHHAPIIFRISLNILRCGVGIWTVQGFEHMNK